jgi:hypothetical protein
VAITVSSSVNSSGASSVAMVIPVGALADDILILSIGTRSTAALTVTEDSGETWTLKDRISGSTHLGFSLYWRRAATDPSGSTIHINGGNNSMLGGLVTYSGCSTSGDPMESFNSTVVLGSSAGTMTGITALTAGAMIVLAVAESDDRGWSTATAGGTPSSLVRILEELNSLGADCGLGLWNNTMLSSGPTGTFTFSVASSVASFCAHAFALTPAGAGEEPPVTGAVRLRMRPMFGVGW